MFNSDSERGNLILIVSTILFLYYTVWVIGVPFIENDFLQNLLFYSQEVALVVPAIIGLCFVGGLIAFTIYHMSPYIFKNEIKKYD